MKVNIITTGFVIQTFDTETKRFERQEFVASDEVSYERKDGTFPPQEEVDAARESYLPFDMVQPK